MVKYSPSVVYDGRIVEYSFDGEIITATFNGVTDIFDFTDMPNDVEIPISNTKGGLDIDTILPFIPIIYAKRTNDILQVEILKYIGPDATEEEKFPDWIDV